jgi:hypothetical protein
MPASRRLSNQVVAPNEKERPPGNADARDRALFEKLRDHLFRLDDVVQCTKCRRRFDIPSHQTMVFL